MRKKGRFPFILFNSSIQVLVNNSLKSIGTKRGEKIGKQANEATRQESRARVETSETFSNSERSKLCCMKENILEKKKEEAKRRDSKLSL